MRRLNAILIALIALLPLESVAKGSANDALADSIARIISDCPGQVGVALIIDNRDTVAVNDLSVYPMMSVFKLHQALAVCHRLDNAGIPLDSTICMHRDALDPDTWSPMMKDHPEPAIKLPISKLLRYTLIQSDNNACNVMFDRLAGVAETDAFIAGLIPRHSFKITYSEADMAKDHDKAYSNYTSPLGAAMLINRIFTDSLISPEKQAFIKESLAQCVTGQDRLAAPLANLEGVRIAHKTGSGYRNVNGALAAHNDVGYITLPNGCRYALAVFVKDFSGTEAQASQIIARISAAAYSFLAAHPGGQSSPPTGQSIMPL